MKNCADFPKEAEYLVFDRWDDALYQKALTWVDGQRRALFVSEEERSSTDPRVQILPLESPLQWPGIIQNIAWRSVLRRLAIFGEASFCSQLERSHLAAGLILSEAADWGILSMENGRANQTPYRRGLDLQGAFAKIPALIVGAGPSLEKNGHLIREFAQKGLIFAGGTALNVIGVEPHFGGSIDAAAPHEQFKQHPFSQVPFCYQSRMNRENFSLVKGEKLLFPDNASAPLNWIYGEEPFDGGWTVGNFLTAVALHFGCDPILFIGMDLCYTDQRKYAKIETAPPDGLIRVRDVWTQKDWWMAAQWTEAKQGPFLNVTEGGLLALPKCRFEEALSKLAHLGDLHRVVAKKIGSLELHPAPTERWALWDASLERCRVEIDENEIVYEKLLKPLWQVWRPIFAREVEVDPTQNIEIHRHLFFQQVLREYAARFLSER